MSMIAQAERSACPAIPGFLAGPFYHPPECLHSRVNTTRRFLKSKTYRPSASKTCRSERFCSVAAVRSARLTEGKRLESVRTLRRRHSFVRSKSHSSDMNRWRKPADKKE